ncbi:hypothetical protein QM012_002624 [Aureobasidium pullulans]|uniref:Uncharacterized protein n=1 Tax=Aureobasidium pullulans TaxID=5580 RepID=A0ABR0TA29_AURPU
MSIALLRNSIAQIGDSNRSDVLLTVMILQVVEPFSPISQAGGWMTHVDGAAKIFQHEGPRPLKSEYDTALFNHARQYSIIGGILRRKPVLFSQPQWLAISGSAPAANLVNRLIDIGSLVPGLLNETDEARRHDSPEQIFYGLLRKLDLLYEEIVTWIEDFSSSMEHEISTTIDIKEMHAYNEIMEGDTTFLPVFRFASFRTAWRLILGWTFHYHILNAILDILTTRGDIVYYRKAPELELELLRVVTNICMTFPQLFAKDFGVISRAAIMLPLRFSTRFYRSRGQFMELNWCNKIAKEVFSRHEGLNHVYNPEWMDGLQVHSSIEAPYPKSVPE